MADAGVGAVEALGIDAIKLAHALGEVGIGRFDEQVIMILFSSVTPLREVLQSRVGLAAADKFSAQPQ